MTLQEILSHKLSEAEAVVKQIQDDIAAIPSGWLVQEAEQDPCVAPPAVYAKLGNAHMRRQAGRVPTPGTYAQVRFELAAVDERAAARRLAADPRECCGSVWFHRHTRLMLSCSGDTPQPAPSTASAAA